jgi:hypothetical protein
MASQGGPCGFQFGLSLETSLLPFGWESHRRDSLALFFLGHGRLGSAIAFTSSWRRASGLICLRIRPGFTQQFGNYSKLEIWRRLVIRLNIFLTPFFAHAIMRSHEAKDWEQEKYLPERDLESRGEVEARYRRRQGMGLGVAYPNMTGLSRVRRSRHRYQG